jgi:hypothetical protein
MLIISGHKRLRQEEPEFEARFGYKFENSNTLPQKTSININNEVIKRDSGEMSKERRSKIE